MRDRPHPKALGPCWTHSLEISKLGQLTSLSLVRPAMCDGHMALLLEFRLAKTASFTAVVILLIQCSGECGREALFCKIDNLDVVSQRPFSN